MSTPPPGCRRCLRELADATQEDVASSTRLGRPLVGLTCRLCGWANLDHDEARRNALPLTSELGGRPDLLAELVDTDDPAELQSHLRLLRASLATAIRNEILSQPDAARLLLMNLLTGITGEATATEDRVVLVVQQLYAGLLSLGPVRVLDDVPTSRLPTQDWIESLSGLLLTQTMACSLLTELGAGLIGAARLSHGVAQFEINQAGLWGLEVSVNMLRDMAAPNLARLSQVGEVEAAVFGSSITDLLLRLSDTAELARITRVQDEDDLIVVDLDTEDERIVELRRHLLLTDDSLRGHALPAFFLADQRPDSGSPYGAMLRAASVDWLRYLPLLQGGYGRTDLPTPLGFTTHGLITRALTRAGGCEASRLERAVASARGTDAAQPAQRAARAIHADFERDAAEACRHGGMQAVHGLNELNSRPISCGEIDVLAWAQGVAGPVVLVLECKNIDMAFYKDFGIRHIRDAVAKGIQQARRKGEWIASHWQAIGQQLEWAPNAPVVVAAVVTRVVATPWEQGGVAVLRLASLPGLVTVTRTSAVDHWRGDLAASVIQAP